MPHDPWTLQTDETGNGYITYTQDVTAGTTAGNALIFNVEWSTCTTACTGSAMQTTLTNYSPFLTNRQNGFTNGFAGGANGSIWGSGGGAGGGGQPIWEPVQAAALRQDWKDVHESWTRRRAEVKARRLFRRVVGEIAFKRFRKRGFHELYGASRTRYRLRPGFRVQVMGKGDEVDYELCAHLKFGIPWYDSMAVQALMLSSSIETEEKFKAIANRHPAHGPYPEPAMTEAA
jgi:hypothetical protein